jgi:hypothetical protein
MSAEDKRARRDRLKQQQQPPSVRARVVQAALILVGLVVLVGGVRTVWNNMLPPPPPRLTEAETKTLNDAIAKKGYDAPYSMELDPNRRLTVTFIRDDPVSPTFIKNFALDRMKVVREAFGKKSPAKSYWVYIKASAMDPDMMMRWGHAIYDKGDSVEWVVGK